MQKIPTEQKTPPEWKQPAEEQQNRLLAALLAYGTWLACGLIAVGLVFDTLLASHSFGALQLSGDKFLMAGVALFILLPVLRVCLMLGLFLRQHETLYSLIAILVLAIMATGTLLAL